MQLDDWLDQLRSDGAQTVWLMQLSSRVADKQGKARGDKLIAMWVRQLAAAAAGLSVTGYLVARDMVVTMAPLDRDEALQALRVLAAWWRDGMDRPLPTACKTALALVGDGGDGGSGENKANARTAYDGSFELQGENQDLCLARLWPDYSALSAQPDFERVSQELYGPLARWLEQCITMTSIDGEDAA